MRKDVEAMMQMPKEFASEKEEEDWNDRNKEITRLTHSFSGSERNRLFLNHRGERYQDISGISGLDSPSDGRVLVQFDYNRDGWIDFAVVNSNRPLLQLFRNRMADRLQSGHSGSPANRFVAVRLVGGNDKPAASPDFSARDAIGAKVTVRLGDVTRVRERRCGEGFAGQNSSTILFGIGEHEFVDEVTVRWPSGRTQSVPRIDAGTLVTIFENKGDVPGEAAWLTEKYARPQSQTSSPSVVAQRPRRQLRLRNVNSDRLNLVTTMASWCAACARHQPQLHSLQKSFGANVQVFGFPFDEEDGIDELNEFVDRHNVSYRLLKEPTTAERTSLREILAAHVDPDTLPSSIVTDRNGDVLLVTNGIPTVSHLRKLLRQQDALDTDE